MTVRGEAQGHAESNVVDFHNYRRSPQADVSTDSGTVQKPKRGRPRKDPKSTPAPESFDHYAGLIRAIPRDRRTDETPLPDGVRGWLAAKDVARQVVNRDRRHTPTACNLFNAFLTAVNHAKGKDWHPNGYYAQLLGVTKCTIERAVQNLVSTGAIVRRSVRSKTGDWACAETTLPALVRAAFDPTFGGDLFSCGYPQKNGEVPAENWGRGTRENAGQTSSTSQPLHEDPKEERRERGSPAGSPAPAPATPSKAKSDSAGTRLPKDWTLPREWREWAFEQIVITGAQIEREAKRFRDHWHATPGAKGRKSDWPATWRNWLRREYPDKAFLPQGGESQLQPFTWRGRERGMRLMPADWWEAKIAACANGSWPYDLLGPAPGAEGCLVPAEVITKLHLIERYGKSSGNARASGCSPT